MRRGASRSAALAAIYAAIAIAIPASVAQADFPYLPPGAGNPHDPATFKLPPGTVPSEFSGGVDWKFSATPEQSTQSNLLVNGRQDELCGIRGASIVDSLTAEPVGCRAGQPIKTAWQVTTGQPKVLIAVLDSGIEWNNAQAMSDLRDKVHLNQGELPAPRHDLATALIAGVSCASYANATGGNFNPSGDYDVNRDGVFNVRDYACDSRVARAMSDPRRHGPTGMLTPEDLIIAFTDGSDHDHNGFANDIAGWNFLDDNNNPYDDVQYGHGTGEARDSNAEANNGGDVGSCPNCMVLPLRVGESFVADVNRFAEAALYATDSGAYVIQEALGTLNSSLFARQAIDYAYNHGVVVIASAADEAAEHHNPPASLPHAIVVNSVNKYESLSSAPPSYLQLNGCTNFGTRITLSVPSSSCSSEATGKSAGVAGLIESAALNAIAAGKLRPAQDCRRVDGTRCPLTANEVRELMASGNIGSTAPADSGTGQADDINFAAQPEPSCTAPASSTCTDPNLNTNFALDELGGVVGPFPNTHRYHARKGFDEFFGYGRLNAYKAVSAAAAGNVPPQAEITAPDWFQQLDPRKAVAGVHGYVNARGAYRCRVYVAPGAEPNNALTTATPRGDFAPVASSWCDGATVHSSSFGGLLATLDLGALRARFPSNVGNFDGNENGNVAQTADGRPNTLPYAFTIRVLVTTASGTPMSGEDRRQLFLHHDRDLRPGFPKELQTDGASSPVLADIDGDNRNELVLATSDGLVHAFRANGTEPKGWPVHTDLLPLHLGEHAFTRGGVPRHDTAVLGALAAGDLFGDGRIEIVADDLQGRVYAWDGRGHLVFKREANRAYSGSPLSALQTIRQGPRDRTEHGFLSSPVLASLNGGRQLDIIAAGEDRHVYAWKPNGKTVSGFPVLVADPDKVASVDPRTHHLTFNGNVNPSPGIDEDQGKIVDTPAVARINGPSQPPAIIVGTNEEYPAKVGDEGPINAGPATASSLTALGATGVLAFANGRVYAIKATGGSFGNAFLPGWPKKVGIINRGLLPDVGEGINGSPIVAPLACPNGGSGMKIGVTPDAGPAYIFNADGSSCYGQSAGADNPLEVDASAGSSQTDRPAFAAVGYPAFGTLDGQNTSLFTPTAGITRAIDIQLNEYQGGQDFIAGWNVATGQQLPSYPAEMNDLQFLTGPVVGDILGTPGQEVIGGSSSQDLAAFNASGTPASAAWPKLTGDWTIATPTLGSFGTLDTARSARKDVISITRSGSLSVYSTPAPACSPSSWPRFHHDNANSGDYTRDATLPGKPMGARLARRVLSFSAPGADLLCGTAATYQVATSSRPITPQSFGAARHLSGAPAPGPAGSAQTYSLPAGALRFVALRAVNAAGNVGLPILVDLSPPRRHKSTRNHPLAHSAPLGSARTPRAAR